MHNHQTNIFNENAEKLISKIVYAFISATDFFQSDSKLTHCNSLKFLWKTIFLFAILKTLDFRICAGKQLNNAFDFLENSFF